MFPFFRWEQFFHLCPSPLAVCPKTRQKSQVLVDHIPATQEAEIRRMKGQSQSRQIVHETL
jgi:hypothetical protein